MAIDIQNVLYIIRYIIGVILLCGSISIFIYDLYLIINYKYPINWVAVAVITTPILTCITGILIICSSVLGHKKYLYEKRIRSFNV